MENTTEQPWLANAASEERRRWFREYNDAVALHPEIQRVRTVAFEMFGPTDGERLLDVGCGLGEVARQLGRVVGDRGAVTALDVDPEAIAVAESRADDTPVDYQVGDATCLPFSNGFFDGVRAERFLQHQKDPLAIVGELVRVTRRGGRVCLVDTDWASLTGHGLSSLQTAQDTVTAALGKQAKSFGTTPRGLLVKVGLTNVSAMPVTIRFTNPNDAGVVIPIFTKGVAQLFLPADLRTEFLNEVHDTTSEGAFLVAVTLWVTVGYVDTAKA